MNSQRLMFGFLTATLALTPLANIKFASAVEQFNHQTFQLAETQTNLKKVTTRDLKVITTEKFEDNHLAKNREEALKKARARKNGEGKNGGELLHYMKKTDLSSLPNALKKKFHKELSEKDFKKPKADIGENNYWTGLKVTVWEYDKKKDKINERTGELCLGLINFHVNKENKVEVGVNHLEGVR